MRIGRPTLTHLISDASECGEIEFALGGVEQGFAVRDWHQQLEQLGLGEPVLGAGQIRGQPADSSGAEARLELVEAALNVRAKRFAGARRRFQHGPMGAGAQIEQAVALSEALLLHLGQAQRVNRHSGRADQEHVARQADRKPRQRRDDITIERIQLVQIVDEQEEDGAAVRLLAPPHQVLKPCVDVERIEGRVLGQVALRNVQDDGNLLADDAQQLQIVGRARSGRREAYHAVDFRVLEPGARPRVQFGDERALAGARFAVDEVRRVAAARLVALHHGRAHQIRHRRR